MGFFSSIFGNGEDTETRKALVQRIKSLEGQLTELREKDADDYHDIERGAFLDRRELQEDAEDTEHRFDRRVSQSEEKVSDTIASVKREAKLSTQDAIDSANEKQRAALEKKNEQIAELQSEIRTLKLTLEEQTLDVDLQIQEAVLDKKEAHLEETSALEVKLAKQEGLTLAAKAEASAKDEVIKALSKMLEKSGETQDTLIEAISEVAPKINLEKLGFEVTVPVQANKSNDQQKKQ